MTNDQMIKQFKEIVAKMTDTMERKNHDYGGNEDPFNNFTMVEKLRICDTEQGFLTRMTDKLARITTFVNKGVLKVEDEKVEDTLQDLAVYSILLLLYIRSKK